MQAICGIQIQPLLKIMEAGAKPVQGLPQNDPAVWLDRLAAVFRYCQPEVEKGALHPCQPVITEVWPILSKACSAYQTDIRIVERCCRSIRYAVRCLGKNSAELLSPLVMQIVEIYNSQPHSCFLYLGSILVDEYGTDPQCVHGLTQMLEAFCTPTFVLLEKGSLRNHPDTVDDLFRLCIRFVQRAPVAFLQSSPIQTILRVAIAGVTLDHKDANASVTKFLTELCKNAWSKDDKADFATRSQLVRALLAEVGQSLTSAIVNSAIFALPSYMIHDTIEVLYEMRTVNSQVSVIRFLLILHCYTIYIYLIKKNPVDNIQAIIIKFHTTPQKYTGRVSSPTLYDWNTLPATVESLDKLDAFKAAISKLNY